MKLEALEVLKNRRSIRSYEPRQVETETLKLVLEAGTYGATGMNTQSPYIVAVQNPQQVALLNRLNADVLGKPDSQPYYGAPTIVIVFANPQVRTPFEDALIVATNIINAAYAADLGSCWINRSRQMFETPEGKELMRQWGIPESCYGAASISLGYATGDHPTAKPRKEDYYRIIP